MMAYSALLILLGTATLCRAADDDAWNAFKSRYHKRYANSTEDSRRREIWESNWNLIETHNQQAAAGLTSYTLGENQLTDLLPEEYQRMLGYRSDTTRQNARVRRSSEMPPMPTYYQTVSVSSLPSYVNWTQHGWVGPVMNQGTCGSCWAYAATGSLQGQYYNNTKELIQLSQQNLIECSWAQGNLGCSGGNVQNAFWYVQTDGIEALATYPDTSNITGLSTTNCKFSASESVMQVLSWRDIDTGSESAQQQAVALVGPVSVALDASGMEFQLYKEGIYESSSCSRLNLNHAVTAVGYGVYNGQDYWLLQNSWGTSWGMNGYMMMARNENNMCGIATDSTFPLLDTSSVSMSQGGGELGAAESDSTSTPASHATVNMHATNVMCSSAVIAAATKWLLFV